MGVQKQQGWLEPGLFYRAWLPETPLATCVICHGYAEHSGRYHAVAERLVSQHIAVYALDLPGHGRSAGKRASAASVKAFVPQLQKTLDHAKAQHPDVPSVLLGHSMGGLLALQTCLTGHTVDVLCVSGAMLQNAVPVSGILTAVAKVLAQYVPDMPVQALDAQALAFDAQVVANYQHDPLIYHGKVRTALGYGLLTEGKQVLEHAPRLNLPTLIMHGKFDTIADPAGSRRLYERLASSDKTLELLNGKHEIFNDICRLDALNTLTGWLETRLNT